MKKGLFEFNVRDIVEIAIFCALAIVLDTFVKIPLGATGGSINISMIVIVPLYLPLKSTFISLSNKISMSLTTILYIVFAISYEGVLE